MVQGGAEGRVPHGFPVMCGGTLTTFTVHGVLKGN